MFTRTLEARQVARKMAAKQRELEEKTLRDRKIDIRIKVDRERQELSKQLEINRQKVWDSHDSLIVTKKKELDEYSLVTSELSTSIRKLKPLLKSSILKKIKRGTDWKRKN